ncbi:MAG: hypothetical protein ABI895_09305 [Deltaproteobacteria bacterium]
MKHVAGVVDAPGLYVLWLPYLRRRKSSAPGMGARVDRNTHDVQA